MSDLNPECAPKRTSTDYPEFMSSRSSYALNAGAKEEELKEIVNLTTVHAGFPRAVEAAQTLSEMFKERTQKPGSATRA